MEIYFNIKNVFTVNFEQLNVVLMDKSINI